MNFHWTLPVLLILMILGAFWQWTRIMRPNALFRWLGALTAIALGIECVALWLAMRHIPNVTIYNTFDLLEFVMVLAMVNAMYPRWSTMLALVGAAGTLAMGICLWSNSGLTFLLTEGIVAMYIPLTGVCLAVLWKLALSSRIPLQRVPEFWLFLGMLAYFGGVPPIVGAERYLYMNDHALAQRLYSIIPFLALVRYVLTAVACSMAALASRRNTTAWQA